MAKLVFAAVGVTTAVIVTAGTAQAQSGSLRMAEHQNLAGDHNVYVTSDGEIRSDFSYIGA